MLSAKNLVKKYNQLEVLKNVSLEIAPGSFISIVGPSGAGKSTLLHLLSSLDTPTSGEVFINQQNIVKLNNKQQANFRNKHFGFVFQFHHLLPEFNALENVCMPLWIANAKEKDAKNKAAALLESVGLAHRLLHKPHELSGGEQQRVAIARALVHQPSYLFADEPTGNLDSANAATVHQLFKDIQEQYKLSLILVTHNDHLAKLAHTTYEMQDGTIKNIIQN